MWSMERLILCLVGDLACSFITLSVFFTLKYSIPLWTLKEKIRGATL